MKVLITGATGLIGKEVGKKLVSLGHEVTIVSRDSEKARLHLPFPAEILEGDLSSGPLKEKISVDAIVHLMGESVGERRWSKDIKKRILESRRQGTKNLFLSLAQAPQVAFSASAVGYYANQGDVVQDEASPPGNGFLSEVCKEWENLFLKSCQQWGVPRSGVIRIGMVLSPWGGALKKLLPLFMSGLGAPLGDGKQKISWIHIEDLSNLFVWALMSAQAQGIFNGVSPHPCTNLEFTKALAHSLHVFSLPRVPKSVIQVLFGEMSELLLGSTAVLPTSALAQGFRFLYPQLERALEDLCRDFNSGEVFYSEQFLPADLIKVFSFFSDEINLEKLTPPSLQFNVLKKSTDQIQSGTLIDYRLKLHGVPLLWRTRIEDWEPPRRFSDNQEKGPYRRWFHTHEFAPLGNGVLMKDRVCYRLPLGYLGKCVAGSMVRHDIEKIFEFRRSIILKEMVQNHLK